MKYKAYPEYKDSGVEWLGDIPSHWSLTRIKFITTCLDGSRVPLNSEERGRMQGDIPYWGANNVVDYVNDFIFDEELILLGEDGAPFFDQTKDVAFNVDGKVWPNNHVHVLRPAKSQVAPEFLKYGLNCADFHLYISGSTRDKLNQSDMNEIYIRVCELPEQKQIANFLDHETAKIDTLIEKQQQLIKLLKEKRQAVISHAVTKGLNSNAPMKDSGIEWLGEIPAHWEMSKMRYMFSFDKGLTITKSDLLDEGVPCVNYGEVHSKYGFEVDPTKHFLKCVNNDYLKSAKNSLLLQGDLIFADTSEDMEGSGNFTQSISNQVVFAGYHTIIARPKIRECTRFYAYMMDSIEFRTQIRKAVKGVKVFSITQAILRNSDVWLPPITEQKQITDFLDHQTTKIDELISKAEQAIELIKERRTAFISAAVTGKIDVRHHASRPAGEQSSSKSSI